MTQKEFAAKLGIGVRQLRRLVELGMPTDDLAAAKTWRAANIDTPAPAGEASLSALKAALYRKRVELIDLQVRERRRDLIPADEARRIVSFILQSLQAQLPGVTLNVRSVHPLDENVCRTLTMELKSVADLIAKFGNEQLLGLGSSKR